MKPRDYKKNLLLISSLFCLSFSSPSFAQETKQLLSPTKVGNGDNGADLEGFELIKAGPILSSRDKALLLIQKLNLKNIRSLGSLEAELKNSELYITKKDITDNELLELGAFETDRRGYVYARTFARPHAATRFFPISNTLNEDQLVSLHIHEALHRTLPSPQNEDEKIVSKITLAITSPDSSYDQVRNSIDKHIPFASLNTTQLDDIYLYGDTIDRSIFEYQIDAYKLDKSEDKKIGSTHSISSKLYPFGGRLTGTGLGIGLKWHQGEGKTELGALALSLQHQLTTITRFKVFAFMEGQITPQSSNLYNSTYGRDIARVGLQMYSFKNKNINLINTLNITLPSTAKDSLGSQDVKYNFGAVYNANITLRGLYKNFGLGGFVDYVIAEEMKTVSGNFTDLEKRTSLAALGLELGYFGENYAINMQAKKLISQEENQDFSRLGDVSRYGVGDASLSLGVKFLW